jgi:hypothetical protein
VIREVTLAFSIDEQDGTGERNCRSRRFPKVGLLLRELGSVEKRVTRERRGDGVRLAATVIAPPGLNVEVVPPTDAGFDADGSISEGTGEA